MTNEFSFIDFFVAGGFFSREQTSAPGKPQDQGTHHNEATQQQQSLRRGILLGRYHILVPKRAAGFYSTNLA
jgi:hypothetical protein